MTSLDIPHQRLHNQRISRPTFQHPSDVVSWFGAVQAQDYPGALWALGLRMQKATEAAVEQAIADKTIVRTWPMRGTLHFVAAADVRWMLGLLASRMITRNQRRLEKDFELDAAALTRCQKLLVRALEGGKQVSRPAMYQVLEAGKISTSNGRGLQILSHLALNQVLCFGKREGKQPTFTLLEEWAPTAKTMERDAALAEIARRYFTSHGPATLQDFIWWSGLAAAEAREGLELAKPHLVQEVIGGQTYWLAPSTLVTKDASPTAYLLPAYDEYTVAYKDRSAVLNPVYARQASTGNGIFNPIIVVDGQVAGTWKRMLKKDTLVITPSPFAKLTKAESRAIAAAASRYGKFLDASVVLP
ncbi:MAG: winged helix DNA-binding domain-containing protein [Acidobacteriota bacterium]